MFKWLHHFFNPHCPDCSLEKECRTCDTLRSLLEAERYEKKQLLQQILDLTKPQTEIQYQPVEIPKPLKPNFVPWKVKQHELEEADRLRARIMKDREKQVGDEPTVIKTTEDLEKEIGIGKEDAS